MPRERSLCLFAAWDAISVLLLELRGPVYVLWVVGVMCDANVGACRGEFGDLVHVGSIAGMLDINVGKATNFFQPLCRLFSSLR